MSLWISNWPAKCVNVLREGRGGRFQFIVITYLVDICAVAFSCLSKVCLQIKELFFCGPSYTSDQGWDEINVDSWKCNKIRHISRERECWKTRGPPHGGFQNKNKITSGITERSSRKLDIWPASLKLLCIQWYGDFNSKAAHSMPFISSGSMNQQQDSVA